MHETAAVVPLKVQVPENVPVPLDVRVTVPDGAMKVPTSVSVTVAVQVEAWFTTTELPQVIDIEVARLFTVMVLDVLGPLPLWAGSPP